MLRGMGVAMALPWMESMGAAAPSLRLSEPPLRMAFLFMPNGVRPDHWTPPGDAEDYEITPHLSRVATHKSEFTLLENLWHERTTGRNGHWPKVPAWLSGGYVERSTGRDLNTGATSRTKSMALGSEVAAFSSADIKSFGAAMMLSRSPARAASIRV